jgi:hypothetical protein
MEAQVWGLASGCKPPTEPFLHDIRAVVIKDQGTRQQLHMRKERTSGRIFRKTIELEIVK